MTSASATLAQAFPGRSLPVELMSMILDNVNLTSLLRLSHTSRRWRAVARSHPCFWRNIRLAAVSNTALDLFHARLDQTTDVDIQLDIMLPDALEHGRIRSVVLPAVARNLHRIVDSQIMLHHDTAPYALSFFTGAASRLQHFALGFFNGNDKPPVQLPYDILSGSCQNLRILILKNTSFPVDTILAFDRVHHLLFGCDGPYVFPVDLFRHFPALRILEVHGETCLGVEPPGEPAREAAAPQLATFAVHVTHCDIGLFGAVPHLSSIAKVKCREPHVDLMRTLLDHLPGVLELAVVTPTVAGDQIEVAFSAPDSARSRVFLEHAACIQSDWPRDIVFAPDVAERVTALRLTARLAYLVPLFAALPACTTLVVEVGAPEDLTAQPATLALPGLKSVTVRGRPGQDIASIDAESLRDFIVRLVGTHPTKPALIIEDSLPIIGNNAGLWEDYDIGHISCAC